MLITNKKYNIKGCINTRICLISDIHYHDSSDIKYLNKVINKIKKQKPEYICIPGDLVDECNIYNEDEFINWLIRLSNITKVIISIGNHEFYLNKKNNIYGYNKDLFNKLEKLNNVYLLDNENLTIDNINFMGLTLSYEYYYRYNESLNSFKEYIKFIKSKQNCYNVLLCHSPVNLFNEDIINILDMDLILCGHMHGGLLPKIFRPIIRKSGLISPSKKLFPKNSYGNTKIGNTNIIITSGISVISNLNPFRKIKKLFSGEIVNIKIYK